MRYRFRAEAVADLVQLRRTLDEALVDSSDWMVRAVDLTRPDVECSFECDLELEMLRHAAEIVVDGQVICATLAVDEEFARDRSGLEALKRN